MILRFLKFQTIVPASIRRERINVTADSEIDPDDFGVEIKQEGDEWVIVVIWEGVTSRHPFESEREARLFGMQQSNRFYERSKTKPATRH